jgi:hypothetical protein
LSIRTDILKTLAYFDMFDYPLTQKEIKFFLGQPTVLSAINEHLKLLMVDKIVFQVDEFYSLQMNLKLAERRRKGNAAAIKEMKNAEYAASILSKFPYIKGIAVSGSLSKNYCDESTDIDFFMITSAGRLWIARTFLHIFYKFAWLAGKQRLFCLNYYIDEQAMEIEEKNIFTAIEIVTLLPMKGGEVLERFIQANAWTKKHLPMSASIGDHPPVIKKGIVAALIEKFFNGPVGDTLDKWLMRLTKKRWDKKVRQHKTNQKGINIGMLVNRHYSKPDPKNFQDKILARYEQKVTAVLKLQSNQLAVENIISFETK